MAVRIQFRRGTAAEWTSADPTLAPGELGYETDTAKFKLGDGSTSWSSLDYAGINQDDIDNAVANVIDLAPETLNTLNELAASIGDDSDFAGTIANDIASAVATAEANAQSYANTVSTNAQSAAQSYADNAIANLIDSSPSTLDTLNELAAALGDDPNFATTITNNLSTKISFVADTNANIANNTATSVANTFYFAADSKSIWIGDGVTAVNELDHVAYESIAWAIDNHNSVTTNVHGIADTSDLVVQSDLSSHTSDTQNVHGIADTSLLVTTSDLEDHANVTTNVHGIADTSVLATLSDITGHNDETTNVHGISNTANLVYQTDLDSHANTTENVHGIADTSLLVTTSDLNDFANVTVNIHGIVDTSDLLVTNDLATHNSTTTNVHGISDTSDLLVSADLEYHTTATTNVHGIANTSDLVVTEDLGGATSIELGYVSGVTSSIQTQLDVLDNTLSNATSILDDVPTTYATISNTTLNGTVSLPATTSIGDVSSVEISYLANVTSNIQDQLGSKLNSATASSTYAPLNDPTFTGDVVMPVGVTIGNVISTEISYLEGVTSSIQGQLDDKLDSADAANTYAPIDSPTFTTAATLPASTDIGNVTATEISYLEGVTSALQAQIDAKAALAGATFTGAVEAPDVTITGNLIVQGSTTTISATDLKIQDNMVYLNQAGLAVVTDATGDGTNVVYTTEEAHGFEVGYFVAVSNVTPSSFDASGGGLEIIAVTSNTFTVASTVTDTYVSGGTARGKVHSNPDLGWAAGRYADNTYAHAGVFRDATDGVFKFFDGYVPEPDESVFIDTSANTFALAPISVSEVTAANLIATTGVIFPDNTIQTSAGVASLTGFTEKTANYTLDTLDHKDNVVEMNSGNAITFTIPTNAALAWPVGASMDIIQTGAGQVTIANAVGVTLNYTPGNKLRTTWSSCTIMKRGTDSWILYGDLTA